MTRRRLDAELVRRGLAGSRTEAREAVRSGLVRVAGTPALKPSTLVDDHAPVTVTGSARKFVSRGGDKLAAALERWGIDPAGLDCVDAGASTGGFTDCLLQSGAARVVAVDVGYGQLAWSLRTDPRVTVLERTNVRALTAADLPFRPRLVVADLSFISLTVALPALGALAHDDAAGVFLVKPQFEAGRAAVGEGGVVRDPAVWTSVLRRVTSSASTAGFPPSGLMASPLRGPAGNVEFLLWCRRGAPATVDVRAAVSAAVEEGRMVAA